MTNYIAIAGVIFIGGILLTVLVHPAFGVLPFFVVLAVFLAGYQVWKEGRPAPDEGGEKDDERIPVQVEFEGGSVVLYFNTQGEALHALDTSGSSSAGAFCFMLARVFRNDSAGFLEHVSRRADFAGEGVSLFFSEGTVEGTMGAISVKLEEPRFIMLVGNAVVNLSAVFSHNGWGDVNVMRDAVALFLLREAARLSHDKITELAVLPDSPHKQLENFAAAEPNDQVWAFALLAEETLVILLRILPPEMAWKCMRSLPPKIRLQLVEAVAATGFPVKAQWQLALQTFHQHRN